MFFRKCETTEDYGDFRSYIFVDLVLFRQCIFMAVIASFAHSRLRFGTRPQGDSLITSNPSVERDRYMKQQGFRVTYCFTPFSFTSRTSDSLSRQWPIMKQFNAGEMRKGSLDPKTRLLTFIVGLNFYLNIRSRIRSLVNLPLTMRSGTPTWPSPLAFFI